MGHDYTLEFFGTENTDTGVKSLEGNNIIEIDSFKTGADIPEEHRENILRYIQYHFKVKLTEIGALS